MILILSWEGETMATEGLTGGCQCGAVRYRLATPPRAVSICHCRMCQKATGSPYGAYANLQRDDLVFTRGAPKIFASSDIAERGFCADCGTPLTFRAVTGGRISVTVCSLDDPNAAPPQLQLDAQVALAWVHDCLTKPNTPIADYLKSKNIAEIGARQHPDHD